MKAAGAKKDLRDEENWRTFAPGTSAHDQEANSFVAIVPGGNLKGGDYEYHIDPLSKRKGFSLKTAGHPSSAGLWEDHGTFNTHKQAMKAAHEHCCGGSAKASDASAHSIPFLLAADGSIELGQEFVSATLPEGYSGECMLNGENVRAAAKVRTNNEVANLTTHHGAAVADVVGGEHFATYAAKIGKNKDTGHDEHSVLHHIKHEEPFKAAHEAKEFLTSDAANGASNVSEVKSYTGMGFGVQYHDDGGNVHHIIFKQGGKGVKASVESRDLTSIFAKASAQEGDALAGIYERAEVAAAEPNEEGLKHFSRLDAENAREWHHVSKKNADGTPMRVRRNGKTQTWKTRPGEFRIPVKHGMYDYGDITHETASQWKPGDGRVYSSDASADLNSIYARVGETGTAPATN